MARPGLRNHPKFRRLMHLLGESESQARGCLECMWDVAYECGNPVIGDAIDVQLACKTSIDSERLVRSLMDSGGPGRAGFIEQDEDGRYIVHDLFDHAPSYVQTRADRESERQIVKACEACGTQYHASDPRSRYCSAACRQLAHRKRNGVSQSVTDASVTERNDGVPRVTDESVVNAGKSAIVTESNGALRSVTESNTTPAPAPAPAPNKEKSTSCPETGITPLPADKPMIAEPAEVPILTFPCDGPVRSWELVPSYVKTLREIYPSLDVVGECRKAFAWIDAAPSRRKTANGMKRFITGWLSRSQDQNRGGTKLPIDSAEIRPTSSRKNERWAF